MAQCVYPYMVDDSTPVPCGKCYNCRNKRVAGWAFRLMNKDRHSRLSFFITLTYDTDHLMFCEKGRPTLYPSHLTNFWKIFRKRFKTGSLKYYACGEYGSNKKRPHYHAIVFCDDKKVNTNNFSKWLEEDWKHGSVYVGTVTGESIAYTLKYISKTPSVPQYSGDKRVPEFQRTSKGLGADYIKQTVIDWHHADFYNRAYLPLNGGGKAPIPRYYKDKLYTKEQRAMIGVYMSETQPQRDYEQLKNARKYSQNKLKA